MPPMGPPGRRNDFKKPKNAKKTFTRILKYMGKNKLFLILVFLMLILSTVCNLLASYCLKPILNDIAASIKAGTFMNEGIKTLVKNLVVLTLFYVGASIFSFAQSKIMVNIAYKTTNIIRKDLFDHMQTLPLKYFDSQTHGEIMSRFTNDVDNVQMMLEQSMVQLVSSIFTFVGIVAMMIILSPTLFAFALVFLIIMLVIVSKIGKQSRKYFRQQQKNLGVMNGNIEETVEGMKVIKVFNHEQQAVDEFEEKFEGCSNIKVCANLPYYITSPIIMMLLESELNIDEIVVMVQKEAGERLCAKVGTRQAGAVSVAVNFYADGEILFDVPRESFMPSPKVDSVVIRLKIGNECKYEIENKKKFFSVVKCAFAQRRKTALNSISNTMGVPKAKLTEIFEELGLDINIRPEKLTMENLIELSEKI
jgi:16S rRNA A1518/A1519 N6-dimethyltransferase RsmA/KsgA/DIM1 with predicted DNA glycosylase/AP lyase activity